MGGRKVGYVKICPRNGTGEFLMALKELYADKEYLETLRNRQGVDVELFCGCVEDYSLPLFITKTGVIRVAHNGQQMLHQESCPKSAYYERYLKKALSGVTVESESGEKVFHLFLPSAYTKPSSVGGSSGSEPREDSGNHRTGIDELVCYVVKYAWEKQTFSIKKKIREASRQKIRAEWSYKNFDDFMRLFFGVCADIHISSSAEVPTLKDMCYSAKKFSGADYTQRFFFYAPVLKLSEYRPERKYQYLVLGMSSSHSRERASVRMKTKDFEKLFLDDFGNADIPRLDGCTTMLAGYCSRSSFEKEDGTVAEWINVLKCTTLFAHGSGLLCRNLSQVKLYDHLIGGSILFTVPYEPVGEFSILPDARISKQNGADELYFVCSMRKWKKIEKEPYDEEEFFLRHIPEEDESDGL